MKPITIEELEQMDQEKIIVIDVRNQDDFSKGSMEHTINIPIAEFENKIDTIEKGKPVYILCYTGDRSLEIVEMLEDAGYEAANIIGGYRSFLRIQLERFLAEEETKKEKTKEIERSIIKKFRKPIWRKFTKAVNEYQLIQEGDKIAVCISGGKDSMLMAKLFQELQKHGKFLKAKNPNIEVICVEPAASPVLSGGKPGVHKIQGIGPVKPCEVLDQSIYKEVITVTDEDAYETSRNCAKTEGMSIGISAGAILWAAIQVAKRKENKGKNIVFLFPDKGERYLSSGLYDE